MDHSFGQGFPIMVGNIEDTSTNRVRVECRVRHRTNGCKKSPRTVVTVLPKRQGGRGDESYWNGYYVGTWRAEK